MRCSDLDIAHTTPSKDSARYSAGHFGLVVVVPCLASSARHWLENKAPPNPTGRTRDALPFARQARPVAAQALVQGTLTIGVPTVRLAQDGSFDVKKLVRVKSHHDSGQRCARCVTDLPFHPSSALRLFRT
jgi:hypothetical protein